MSKQDFEAALQEYHDAGGETTFAGPVGELTIKLLEANLGPLPEAYREFVAAYGAGGMLEEWLGVWAEPTEPGDELEESVMVTTKELRTEGLVPDDCVVVSHDEEQDLAHLLSQGGAAEPLLGERGRVAWFDLAKQKVIGEPYENFWACLADHFRGLARA